MKDVKMLKESTVKEYADYLRDLADALCPEEPYARMIRPGSPRAESPSARNPFNLDLPDTPADETRETQTETLGGYSANGTGSALREMLEGATLIPVPDDGKLSPKKAIKKIRKELDIFDSRDFDGDEGVFVIHVRDILNRTR